MSPFDPNYKSQIPLPTARERGHASAARKQSARAQERLDRCGPTTLPTAEGKAAAAAKTARIKQVLK